MKSSLLSLAGCAVVTSAAAIGPTRSGHGRGLLALPTQAAKREKLFGDTNCPCIGFDNIRGTTIVNIGDAEVSFPADLGSRCEAWDDGRHPSCKEGKTPGFGNGFCMQQWCYVDPCKCDIPVMPKMATYLPDAMYRGKPLYFSYASCGGEDMFSKELPEIGTTGCRCIGFDNVPGQTEVTLPGADGKPTVVAYPAEIGGTCRAWDAKLHPECLNDDSPSWCRARWCYVDPCSCNLETPPKVTMYLPEATFTGKSLYYSYETCGEEDTFTKKHNPEACVNQYSEKDCEALLRVDGAEKCAWTGRSCLGKELVEHPLCDKLVEVQDSHGRSGADATDCHPIVVATLMSAVASFWA